MAEEDALLRTLEVARAYIASRAERPVWPATTLTALRSALVSHAEAAAKVAPAGQTSAGEISPHAQQELTETIRKLNELSLPIGWAGPDDDLRLHFAEQGWWGGLMDIFQRHFVGWMLTAFAGTLGAPFWFDLLNRFINIRSAGKAPEEKPKDPKEVPLPAPPGVQIETGKSAKMKTDPQ